MFGLLPLAAGWASKLFKPNWFLLVVLGVTLAIGTALIVVNKENRTLTAKTAVETETIAEQKQTITEQQVEAKANDAVVTEYVEQKDSLDQTATAIVQEAAQDANLQKQKEKPVPMQLTPDTPVIKVDDAKLISNMAERVWRNFCKLNPTLPDCFTYCSNDPGKE